MMVTDEARQRGHPMKTWLDCLEEDMKSFGLSQVDEQIRDPQCSTEIKMHQANLGFVENCRYKCVSVCIVVLIT